MYIIVPNKKCAESVFYLFAWNAPAVTRKTLMEKWETTTLDDSTNSHHQNIHHQQLTDIWLQRLWQTIMHSHGCLMHNGAPNGKCKSKGKSIKIFTVLQMTELLWLVFLVSCSEWLTIPFYITAERQNDTSPPTKAPSRFGRPARRKLRLVGNPFGLPISKSIPQVKF